jgi:hypothetical protein
VVQAYRMTTQPLTTADIRKVTAVEIERQPMMNPLLALEGKVAGLDVMQTSGYQPAIYIRSLIYYRWRRTYGK